MARSPWTSFHPSDDCLGRRIPLGLRGAAVVNRQAFKRGLESCCCFLKLGHCISLPVAWFTSKGAAQFWLPSISIISWPGLFCPISDIVQQHLLGFPLCFSFHNIIYLFRVANSVKLISSPVEPSYITSSNPHSTDKYNITPKTMCTIIILIIHKIRMIF